jgi:hypothetical protein
MMHEDDAVGSLNCNLRNLNMSFPVGVLGFATSFDGGLPIDNLSLYWHILPYKKQAAIYCDVIDEDGNFRIGLLTFRITKAEINGLIIGKYRSGHLRIIRY